MERARREPARRPDAVAALGALLLVVACAPVPLRPQPPSPTPEPIEQVEQRPERGPTRELPTDALFAPGSADLTDDGHARLRAIVTELALGAGDRLFVRGYSDDEGSQAFNIELSEQRAFAVREALLAQGLSPERVRARGLGPRFPVASNASEEGRARNRRITFELRAASTPAGDVP